MGDLVPINKNGFLYFPDEATIDEIRANLAPASDAVIAKSIAMLFTGLKSSDRGDDDKAMTLEIYSLAISSFPDWAIQAAVEAFIMGRVDNASKTFVPSTAELVNETERQMWKRIRKTSPEPQHPSLPANHFSRRWESIKDDVLSSLVVTDEGKR